MDDVADMELLDQYVRQNSEAAFAALAKRHVDLIYSAALRKTGNAAAAEEITQVVFVILARKANTLRRGTVLSGWLYQTARFTAANFLRAEMRRRHYEQEAYVQSLSDETESKLWTQIMPLLDDAMGHLSERDRNAVVLRFFGGKSFQEIGIACGGTENAAKKRVAHALEKLRRYFSKRGVVSTVAIIAGAISARSVQAAPVSLAASATDLALHTAGLSASVISLVNGTLKMMAWAKLKFGIGLGSVSLLTAGVAAAVALWPTDQTPLAILQKAQGAYASLSSYSETLKTFVQTELSDARGVGGSSSDTNTVRLGRPYLYRIENEDGTQTNRFAIWSAGDNAYWLLLNNQFYRGREPQPGSVASPFFAVPTDLVPTAFFGRNTLSPLAAMAASPDLVRQPDELAGEVDCYKLFGSANVPHQRKIKMTVWVGKADLLVRQVRIVTVREIQTSKLAAKSTGGGKATSHTLTHTIVQKHENITVNSALSREDFMHKVPAEVQPSGVFP